MKLSKIYRFIEQNRLFIECTLLPGQTFSHSLQIFYLLTYSLTDNLKIIKVAFAYYSHNYLFLQ